MSLVRTCPNGHRWEAAGDTELSCPVCGTLADELVPPPPVPGPPRALPRIPGYEILGELGRGGMGVVFKARQVGLNRLVALKMIALRPDLPESRRAALLQRFRLEAEAVARLQHPNVVQVFEVGAHDGQPFFSLEYVEGGSLARRLTGRPQPPADSARLVQTLARAVQSAHEQGIVHRDLKPDNILLACREGERRGVSPPVAGAPDRLPDAAPLANFTPKIADFGLAKYLGAEGGAAPGPTESGAVLGTPSYMAPEQARPNCPVGPAADVYALGAILYELLVGRPPFLAETTLDTLLQVVSAEPVPVRLLQPGVPRDLETICHKCLHKEPAQRYQSAADLADDLARFLADRPVLARPVGRLERARRWCARNPLAALLLAGLLLSLTSGLAASTVLWRGEARQRRRAETREQQSRRLLAEFFGRIDHDLRLRQPGTEPLRKDLAADLLRRVADYQDLLRADPGPQTAAELARTEWWRGSLTSVASSPEQAEPLLRQAIARQEKLLHDRPADLAVRADLAQSYQSLGAVLAQCGRHRAAVRALRRTCALLEPAAGAADLSPAGLAALAGAYQNLGVEAWTAGEPVEAQQQLDRAREVWDRLVAREKGEPRWRAGLAGVLVNRANVAAETGEPARARKLYEQARALQEQLLREHPGTEPFAGALAVTCQDLAALHAHEKRLAEARAVRERARAVQEHLLRLSPEGAAWLRSEANNALFLGRLNILQKRLADAQKELQTACRRFDELAAAQPKLPLHAEQLRASTYLAVVQAARWPFANPSASFRTALAHFARTEPPPAGGKYSAREEGTTCFVLGAALLNQRRPGDAVGVLQRSLDWRRLALTRAPRSVAVRKELSEAYFHLGEALRRAGRPAEAAALCRERLKLWPHHAEQVHDGACELARCAEAVGKGKAHLTAQEQAQRQRYLDEAVSVLRRAVELGLQGPAQVRSTSDFRLLRGRADFEKVVGEMERRERAGGR
jgi:serine/threonine protein kinase